MAPLTNSVNLIVLAIQIADQALFGHWKDPCWFEVNLETGLWDFGSYCPGKKE